MLALLRRRDPWHLLACFYILYLHVLCVFRVITSPDVVAAITLGSVVGLIVWNSKRLTEIEELEKSLNIARNESIDNCEALNTLKDVQSTHVTKLCKLKKMLTAVETSPELETMALLGRDLPLGSWYDMDTGTVSALAPQKNTILDTSVRETRTDVCHFSMLPEKMHVSDTLLEFVKSNPTTIKGADRALLRESEMERYVIIVTDIKEKIRCQNALLRDDAGTHTHRIVSVLCGSRVIISLQARGSTMDESILRKLAEGIASTDGSEPDFEQFGDQVDCFVDSDLPLGVKEFSKITLLDAWKLHQSLPEIFSAVESTPIFVELERKHQLQAFCDTYMAMEEAELRCQKFLDKDVVEHFPQLTRMFRAFIDSSIAFRKNSHQQVGQDRLLMLLDDLEDEQVQNTCREKERSLQELRLAASQAIQHLQEIEHLVDIIEKHRELDRPVNILSAEDAETAITASAPDYAVVFFLAATSEMKKSLLDAVEMMGLWISSEILKEHLRQIPIYCGPSESIHHELERFVHLSVHSDALFIITESGEDFIEHTVVYKNAVRLDEQTALPIAEAPSVVDVSHDQFTLLLEPTSALVDFIEISITAGMGKSRNERVEAGADQIVLQHLDQACVYRVNVTVHTPLGPVPCNTEIVVTTGLPQKVHKPMVIQTSATGCALMWRAKNMDSDYQSLTWEIEVTTDVDEAEPTLVRLAQVKQEAEHFTGEIELQPHTTYRFRVRASLPVGSDGLSVQLSNSNFSVQSKPLDMSGSARQIAKSRALRHSKLIESGLPSIRQLIMGEDHVDDNQKLRKVSYGAPECYKPMKTILVVGATGAGKSTLINALANYILGVDFEDDYRFRIIEEKRDANQAKSQTKWVTAYVFYHQANFPAEFPCSLTIIDTPGFGDTAGIAADERITQQLKEYFHGTGNARIDALDAIGFVVTASCFRLTPTQQYIFDSILALFGHDVKENIFALATFADGQKAPVMQALDEAKVPYTQAFKFNNSALFADRTTDEGDENEQDLDTSFWAMGVQSYKKFLTHVSKAQPRSLVLTNQVLDERQHLEARVCGLQTQIKVATTKIESLRSGLDCFQQHQTDIERNKDFEFEVIQTKIVGIPLDTGTYVTNCLTCNRTCHYPCRINDDEKKWACAAMNHQERGEDSTCQVCEKACHWTMHRNMPEKLEVKTEVIRQTVSEMKKEYEQAFEQQLSTEDVIVKIIEDIEYSEIKIACLVNDVRTSLERLNDIALRPDHMTTVGYIDILIRSEQQQAQDGWQGRVNQLENVRERANLISRYSSFEGISEPYRELKTEIMQRKQGRQEGRQEGTGVLEALNKFRHKTVVGVKNLWAGRIEKL